MIRFEPDLEGMQYKDGILSLGMKAGPDYSLFNLFHEMAHFVEIDAKRVNRRQWGLRYGKPQIVKGGIFYEPSTWQATQREIRVAAIQKHIHTHFGLPIEARELTQAFKYIPDYHMVPAPYETRDQFITDKCLELIPKYDWDWFKKRWDARCIVLSKGKNINLDFTNN